MYDLIWEMCFSYEKLNFLVIKKNQRITFDPGIIDITIKKIDNKNIYLNFA